MKLHDKNVYIEYQEILIAGIPQGTIDAALARQSQSWSFITDPSDKRKVLIHYESLKDNYKSLIKAKFGCPYKFMAAQIIKQRLINKNEDTDLITNFKLPDGSNLPIAKQHDYISACNYLNFLSGLTAKNIRELGYKSTNDFYDAVIQLIKGDSVPLPESYNKLRIKVREYREHGAEVVISKKWCNRNSLKVSDEICESLLLEMVAHSSQFEDPLVARKYNEWAKQNGRKEITDATVGIWRRKNSINVLASREGQKVWHNTYNPVVHRNRPTAPLLRIESDDNTLDLFFKEGDSRYRRVTLMVVMDCFNDYPLGYAIGRAQTMELVQEAYLNAIHHIKELTGEHAIWHQICADGWGISRQNSDGSKREKTKLQKWYELQAAFAPTQHGNARGKYIEQFFGKKWHEVLRHYKNYGGYNITAQHKSNSDAIDKYSKEFPSIEQAPAQVAHFFAQLRNQITASGKTKQQQWLEAFNALPSEKKLPLPDDKRILLFGKRHTWLNKITNAGISIALNKHQLTYDIPAADYKQHVGKTMHVIYDPYDLTKVLATSEDGRTQILCPAMEKMQSAIADFAPGDRMRLNVKLNEKKQLSQSILDAQHNRQQLLSQNGVDAESLLQAGVLIKEQRQLAENNYHEQNDEANYQLPEHQPQQEEEDVFDMMISISNNTNP